MATETVVLSAGGYTQLTTGSQNAYIQIMTPGASVLWADSSTQPLVNAPAHILNKELIVGPGLTVWARAGRGSVSLRITKYTAS